MMRRCYGDAGYIGIEKRQEAQGDPCLSAKEYRINHRHESVQRMPSGFIDWEREIERRKSSFAAKSSILF
jgi:hypothetical protein